MLLLKSIIFLVSFLLVTPNILANENRSENGRRSGKKKVIAIIASQNGYYPDRVVIRQGEQVELQATSVTPNPACLMIFSKGIFLPLEWGKLSKTQFSYDTPGIYNFHCTPEKGADIKGKLIVMQKEENKKKMAKSRTLMWGLGGEKDQSQNENEIKRRIQNEWIPRGNKFLEADFMVY